MNARHLHLVPAPPSTLERANVHLHALAKLCDVLDHAHRIALHQGEAELAASIDALHDRAMARWADASRAYLALRNGSRP